MKWIFIVAAGVYLCLQSHVDGQQSLDRSFLEETMKEAKEIVDSAYEYSRRESIARVKRKTASPADILRLLKQPEGKTRSAVRAADYMNVAIDLIKKSVSKRQKRSLSAADIITDEVLQALSDLSGCTGQRRLPDCKTKPNLDRYRTITGVCNNRQKNQTRFGASNTPFVRWLPSEYEDNYTIPRGWEPETEYNDFPLPLSRLVSNRVVKIANENGDLTNDQLYTFLLVIFAQWTDHDLTLAPHSPVIRTFNGGLDCERSCAREEPCYPIQIPRRDPRFGRDSTDCIPFFRSAPACGSGPTGFNFGQNAVRQQINSLTAYIDGSQVYGSDDQLAMKLRDLTSDLGLLRVNSKYDDNGRELLPFSDLDAELCANRGAITFTEVEEVPCFLGGDERASENIALTSLHTMFLREHNRLARALADLNPHWDGERLYQEARKIMGAYFQVIIFKKFLKIMLGQETFDRELGNYTGYDEKLDATISNVFATAAYRFPHTMLQPSMLRLNEDFLPDEAFPHVLLSDNFFAVWRVLFEGGIDPILRGLLVNPAKMNVQDQLMNEELRDRLFINSGRVALDLASLNLQRARDHGIPAYGAWREFCGLSVPRTEAELAGVMNNARLARRLVRIYGTPLNIDPWLGGVAEPLLPGARVGPLVACLVSRQYKFIRGGDRFWWENPGIFTEDQRNSLSETSLARILCDNTGITKVPLDPFFHQDPSEFSDCNTIAAFDLSPWQEIFNPLK
ncbi:eosinophil peroxidase-like [Antennarius striatus]|uniref:eosinophil peroxidase-like n=1 Tax=Antennarius striatus TaxID=241820 RepID=UPI0035B31C2F